MSPQQPTRGPVESFDAFLNDDAWWGETRRLHLEDMSNGFEKWIATEWLLWLRHREGLASDQVGIEYKARLSEENADGGRMQKQIDLWWSAAASRRGAPWHFVELKVVFNNQNQRKMFASAGWDLWYLDRLDAECEKPAIAAVIVIGSRFSDERQWNIGLKRVADESDGVAAATTPGTLGTLRWHAWSVVFDGQRKRG